MEAFECLVDAVDGFLDLAGVAGKFLAEGNGSGVHEVGAADFVDVFELARFLGEGAVESFQFGEDLVVNGEGGGDVDGGGEGIVRGLGLVDVIIGVDGVFRAEGFAGELGASVGDDFVGVHVGGCAGAGLEDIDREVLEMLAVDEFVGGVLDEGGSVFGDDIERFVGFGGGEFDDAVCLNDGGGNGCVGDGEIFDSALGGSAVEGILRDVHFAHGVGFCACFVHGVRLARFAQNDRSVVSYFAGFKGAGKTCECLMIGIMRVVVCSRDR